MVYCTVALLVDGVFLKELKIQDLRISCRHIGCDDYNEGRERLACHCTPVPTMWPDTEVTHVMRMAISIRASGLLWHLSSVVLLYIAHCSVCYARSTVHCTHHMNFPSTDKQHHGMGEPYGNQSRTSLAKV